MSFKDVIGQDRAVNVLQGILKKQKIASSYLFSGEAGIGKKTAAINFAKALNCLNYRYESSVTSNVAKNEEKLKPEDYSSHITRHTLLVTVPDACDGCGSCAKIDSGSHPDVILILPEERQIRIEEIRSIEESLSFKPFEGRRKIVIVDDADLMNAAAANAFLKTLEEPPEGTVIILISSKPERLPDTINSRCSKISFSPLSLEACSEVMKKISSGNIEVASALSMGRPGFAISGSLIEEREWFFDLLKDMLNAERDGWTSREEMERWFDLLLIVLRDAASIKIAGRESNLVNIDIYGQIEDLVKLAELKVIIKLYEEFNRIKNLLNFNLNKSLTWNYTSSTLRKELTKQHA